jgi:predicted DNA-binding protein
MIATMPKDKSKPSLSKRRPFRMIRIPLDLYDRMQELAKRTDRTVTREFIRAAEAHLKAHLEVEE